MNVWSLSWYHYLLHCIFTHILLLLSTPSFSLHKKLLCFLQNVPDIPPHKILALWIRFYNLMHQENKNFSLHKFFWMLGSLWKGNHFSPCCYFNRSLFLFALLQVSTNIYEDMAFNSKWQTKQTILLNWCDKDSDCELLCLTNLTVAFMITNIWSERTASNIPSKGLQVGFNRETEREGCPTLQ